MGEISDKVNKLIETILRSSTWTSAGETRVDNFLKELRGSESFDLENDIKKLVDKESETGKKFAKADKGHMGEINRMTTQQMGNIRQLATDPAGFIIQTFIKKFAKGVGIIAFALIIFESVKWVISELLKPGRWLDLRFKRNINNEIMAFRRREDQQKLKQGFSNIIITTMPRLRPQNGNQVSNTFDDVRRGTFQENIGMDKIQYISSGVDQSKNNGRRSFVR